MEEKPGTRSSDKRGRFEREVLASCRFRRKKKFGTAPEAQAIKKKGKKKAGEGDSFISRRGEEGGSIASPSRAGVRAPCKGRIRCAA